MPSNQHLQEISPGRYETFVGWSALISGIAAIVGLVFIVIFYAGVGIFGPLNDIAYMTQIIFTLPIVFYMYRRLEPLGKSRAIGVTIVGVFGASAVIVLQILLVSGIIPFTTQIGMLLIAIVFVVAWFVLVNRYGHVDKMIPPGRLLAVLAGMTIGYPIWAFRFRRNLKDVEPRAILREEPVT